MAPSKILLFGEHFVVKGKPALGLATDLYSLVCVKQGSGRIYSEQFGEIDIGSKHRVLFDSLLGVIKSKYGVSLGVDIYVDSKTPVGSGMGSSASIAVALAHSILSYMGLEFSREDVQRIAHEAEKSVHYKPSGVDTTLATYGGLLYFKQGYFNLLKTRLPDEVSVIVVHSGVERSTGIVVRDVLARYEKIGKIGEYIYDAAGELVESALRALENGDMSLLGELMQVNHGLLWAMGASILKCDEIVHLLLESGAYGAKISGAGRGGVVIALVHRDKLNTLHERLREHGYRYHVVKPDYMGVRKVEIVY